MGADGEDTAVVSSENVDRVGRIMSSMPLDTLADAIDWLEPWESFSIETERFMDAGDKVVNRDRALKAAGVSE
jgi:hypothetical protein